MTSTGSCINLSQSLYDALRSDYLNRSVVMKPEQITRRLPDIAAVSQVETEKVAFHGE